MKESLLHHDVYLQVGYDVDVLLLLLLSSASSCFLLPVEFS